MFHYRNIQYSILAELNQKNYPDGMTSSNFWFFLIGSPDIYLSVLSKCD